MLLFFQLSACTSCTHMPVEIPQNASFSMCWYGGMCISWGTFDMWVGMEVHSPSTCQGPPPFPQTLPTWSPLQNGGVNQHLQSSRVLGQSVSLETSICVWWVRVVGNQVTLNPVSPQSLVWSLFDSTKLDFSHVLRFHHPKMQAGKFCTGILPTWGGREVNSLHIET